MYKRPNSPAPLLVSDSMTKCAYSQVQQPLSPSVLPFAQEAHPHDSHDER